jgi:hypothetical protein
MDRNCNLNCLLSPQNPLLASRILFLISTEMSLLGQ